MHDHHDFFKHIVDYAAAATSIGVLFDLMPKIAALFTVVWTAMRIAEMVTGREFSELIGMKKKAE